MRNGKLPSSSAERYILITCCIPKRLVRPKGLGVRLQLLPRPLLLQQSNQSARIHLCHQARSLTLEYRHCRVFIDSGTLHADQRHHPLRDGHIERRLPRCVIRGMRGNLRFCLRWDKSSGNIIVGRCAGIKGWSIIRT